jgi:hypothetical protein
VLHFIFEANQPENLAKLAKVAKLERDLAKLALPRSRIRSFRAGRTYQWFSSEQPEKQLVPDLTRVP